MEAELDVLCLVADFEKKQIIKAFLQEEGRPLLASQVEDAHKNTFNIVENLSSVESAMMVGEDGLALSWFIGGGDWFTETELTLKDLSKSGADQVAAALWVDGQIETIFRVTNKSDVEIVGGIYEDLLDIIAHDEGIEEDIFDFLLMVLRP
jgi:hypothetical protein